MFLRTYIQSYNDEAKAGPWSISKTSFEPSRLPDELATDERLDRLSATQKELLQILAVIGRKLPSCLIREVAFEMKAQLDSTLAELQRTEFIYEQPGPNQTDYIFKHALTQEVAYNSLLIERRKRLHERVGQALESMFQNKLEDLLSELAHHYARSDNVPKAVEYLGRAGQQAIQRSAHPDAISNLNAAIHLLP